MTPDPEPLPDDVGRMLDQLAGEDAARVLEQARANAIASAREAIERALVQRLLARCAMPASDDAVAAPSVTSAADASDLAPLEPRDELMYLYGVVSADFPPTTVEGIVPGVAVETVVDETLAAVVNRVSPSEFGAEALKVNLERMDWLERTARGHEAVLESLRRQGTVIPLRICSLFRGPESLRELLTREREPLTQALRRLAGHNEWGVKALVNMAVVERAHASEGGDAAAASPPATGRDYLERKQAARRGASEVNAWVQDSATRVHDTLAAAAAAARRNAVQSRELSGYEDEMVLNGAYLVADADHSDFSQAVAEIDTHYRSAGFHLELTGPWAPYNFVPPLSSHD